MDVDDKGIDFCIVRIENYRDHGVISDTERDLEVVIVKMVVDREVIRVLTKSMQMNYEVNVHIKEIVQDIVLDYMAETVTDNSVLDLIDFNLIIN